MSDSARETDALRPQGAPPSWIVRLLGPLLAWTALALILWKSLPVLAALPEVLARAVSMVTLFASAGTYVWFACRHGAYPRGVWLLAPMAFILTAALSVAVGGHGDHSLIRSMLFLLAAPLLGDMLSRLVEKQEYILPVLVVALVADTWSVFMGPSQLLVESGVVHHLVVSYPVPGRPATPPLPMVGFMDWVFVAFFAQLIARFHLPWKFFGPAIATAVAAGMVALVLCAHPIPLLAALAPAFALFYWRAIVPNRRDALTTGLFLAVLIAVFILVGIIRRGMHPAAPDRAPQSPPQNDLPTPEGVQPPPNTLSR